MFVQAGSRLGRNGPRSGFESSLSWLAGGETVAEALHPLTLSFLFCKMGQSQRHTPPPYESPTAVN